MKQSTRAMTALLMGGVILAGCGSGSKDRHVVIDEDKKDPGSVPVEYVGVPQGAPEAAFRLLDSAPEPSEAAWPFAEGAPKTSGVGRYAHGAYYWTDFLYDATGAAGGAGIPIHHPGTPSGGNLVYPEGAAANNGADIFRVGMALDNADMYLRVDWQTLIDQSIPIAAIAFDYIDGGVADWPGTSGLKVADAVIDAVVEFSHNSAVIHFADGSSQDIGATAVTADQPSRSFVVKVPRTALDPTVQRTQSVAWVASGLNLNGAFDAGAGESGIPMSEFGGLASHPPVFNVAFRDYTDEPRANNFWFDQQQSLKLAENDVSDFSAIIDWDRMAQGVTEPEPVVTGYSNRWYVSSLDGVALGADQAAGIYRGLDGATANPQYFDKIQPYGVYIPTSVANNPSTPARVVLMLHSLTQNHNQYGATYPNLQANACEAQGSICLSTLGRGPAGSYRNEAEVDLWEAWRDLSNAFMLDANSAISTGYSMGANGTIALMNKYPDVFAAGAITAGAAGEAGTAGCSASEMENLKNLKWTPFYLAHGTFDQLIPFYKARDTIDALSELRYRYTFDHFLIEDHVVWALKDELYPAAEALAVWINDVAPAQREFAPGNIDYRFCGEDLNESMGLAPKGPWWIDAPRVGSTANGPGDIRAISHALPALGYEVSESKAQIMDEVFLSPALRDSLRWTQFTQGTAGALSGVLDLDLANVGAVSIDMRNAGMSSRTDKVLCVSTDSPVELSMTGLPNGVIVNGGGDSSQASAIGTVQLNLPAGDHRLSFSDSGQAGACSF